MLGVYLVRHARERFSHCFSFSGKSRLSRLKTQPRSTSLWLRRQTWNIRIFYDTYCCRMISVERFFQNILEIVFKPHLMEHRVCYSSQNCFFKRFAFGIMCKMMLLTFLLISCSSLTRASGLRGSVGMCPVRDLL